MTAPDGECTYCDTEGCMRTDGNHNGAPDGDRLPATNSGQEIGTCCSLPRSSPLHGRNPFGAGHTFRPAPQQPPAQEREACGHGGWCPAHFYTAATCSTCASTVCVGCPTGRREQKASEADSAGEDAATVLAALPGRMLDWWPQRDAVGLSTNTNEAHAWLTHQVALAASPGDSSLTELTDTSPETRTRGAGNPYRPLAAAPGVPDPRCDHEWGRCLNCPATFAASPGVQGGDGEARDAATEPAGGLERAPGGATDVGARERLASVREVIASIQAQADSRPGTRDGRQAQDWADRLLLAAGGWR